METTKIFDIFPSSVEQSSVLRILSANCSRETVSYVPMNCLGLNRLFSSLSNRNDNVCLTIDCCGINPNRPGKFQIKADNVDEQHCFFNIGTNDKLYNTFISKRIRNSSSKINSVQSQIERVLCKSKASETNDVTTKLKESLNNGTNTAKSEVEEKYDSNGGAKYERVGRKFEKYNSRGNKHQKKICKTKFLLVQ